MNTIDLSDLHPRVRIANFFPVNHSQWTNRRNPDFELILVVRGNSSYSDEEHGEVFVGAGQILLIYPGVKHNYIIPDQNPSAIVSCIHLELISSGSFNHCDYNLTEVPQLLSTVKDTPYMVSLFRKATFFYETSDRYNDYLLTALTTQIWLHLLSAGGKREVRQLSRRMEEIVKFIKRNGDKRLTRRDIAEAFYLSPQHINTLFKGELGISPTAFIQKEKMVIAEKLIREEGFQVQEAAAAVGYSDPFYFSKIFKKVMSYTPKHARERA
ncbi:MAG: hypothetical protein B6241_10475 [Spirochaetaceae bacterium 4572_59]|nr:MAG: hypothetical protein B6241_10475 [Spirochaetaceae bacterium 4572_59]